MISIGPHGFRNLGALLVAALLAIVAFMGFASLGGAPHDDVDGRAVEPPATARLHPAAVERYDHSGIAPADPTEPDTTGASVAAYGH